MKPIFVLLTATIACSFASFAQSESAVNSRSANAEALDDMLTEDRVVVSYHVEERINMNFGSRITSYNVPALNLVNTNDLGPNNTRTITPVFAKVKAKPKAEPMTVAINIADAGNSTPNAPLQIAVPATVPKAATAASVKTEAVAIVDVIATYERILDKGYKSIDMLKKVGNSRFFDGNLIVAAKWYGRLFALTTDLDAEYYYRYAQSLKSVNQIQKANEMMAIFENRNL